jgi:hypothetical protein
MDIDNDDTDSIQAIQSNQLMIGMMDEDECHDNASVHKKIYDIIK